MKNMKNKKIKSTAEKNFDYDLMLYKDIETDLKKEKAPKKKSTKLIKVRRIKVKKTQSGHP